MALRTRWTALDPYARVLAVTVAVVVLLAFLDRVDAAAGLDSHVLDIGAEASLTTWFSSFQFGVAALAAAAIAWRGGRAPLIWALIAAGLLLFSVDEVAQLHESAESGSGEAATEDFVLPIMAAALLVAGFFLLRPLRARERNLLLVAGGFLLLAQGLAALNDAGSLSEAVGNGVSAAEEICEMLVGSFALAAGVPSALGVEAEASASETIA